MNLITMTEQLDAYLSELGDKELSRNTILKYSRDIAFFLDYCRDSPTICKKDIISYKEFLMSKYKASTVNSYLISLNRYLLWLGAPQLTAKTLRIQRKTSLDNVITYENYQDLLRYCEIAGKRRDYLLLRTIAGTGIRAGELKYITCEAASNGKVEIYNKGKNRTIVLSEELCQMLLLYCEENAIPTGVIFKGRNAGKALSPKSIWKLMKRLADDAGVNPVSVYPHSLRHLFAKTYMQKVGNIFELADLLGHSNIETTRIYSLSSHEEKQQSLSRLEL